MALGKVLAWAVSYESQALFNNSILKTFFPVEKKAKKACI